MGQIFQLKETDYQLRSVSFKSNNIKTVNHGEQSI